MTKPPIQQILHIPTTPVIHFSFPKAIQNACQFSILPSNHQQTDSLSFFPKSRKKKKKESNKQPPINNLQPLHQLPHNPPRKLLLPRQTSLIPRSLKLLPGHINKHQQVRLLHRQPHQQKEAARLRRQRALRTGPRRRSTNRAIPVLAAVTAAAARGDGRLAAVGRHAWGGVHARHGHRVGGLGDLEGVFVVADVVDVVEGGGEVGFGAGGGGGVGEGLVGGDAAVEFDDLGGEGCGREEDLLVVWDFAECALLLLLLCIC